MDHRSMNMREVIFEELEEDAAQEDKNEEAEITRNQPKNIWTIKNSLTTRADKLLPKLLKYN